MIRNRRTAIAVITTAVVLLTFCLLPAASLACRIIIPPYPWPPHPPVPVPPPTRPIAAMQVKSHHVSVDVRNQLATVAVEAIFHNPNSFRIEGTYLFPISKNAAVSSFAMTVNGRTMEAELLEADKARRIYEEIVRQMKYPALLEYLDEGLLRARVFPIEPNSDVKVQLTYEETLTADSGLLRFSYPLLSARPDGNSAIADLRIEINLETGQSLKTLIVPGFDAAVERQDGKGAHIVYTASNHVPDKDFEVIFSEDDRRVGVQFLSYRKGDAAYFMMLLAPASELQASEIEAKELTFVIDTSGSMMGTKMEQARDALLFCIENLNDADTFNIVAFATDILPFSENALAATAENRAKAREFVANLKPRGGTAINDALSFALKAKPDPERVSMVVFLTDGLPTIGEVDPSKILSNLAGKTDRRVFTFGVGYDVNTRLLDGISAQNGGHSSYVRPEENLELALSSFYDKIAYPVMTDLQLDTGAVKLMDMNPRQLPNLFRGSQIQVTGRFEGNGTVDMLLSGQIGGTREKLPFRADLSGDPQNAFVPRLWAVQRVGFLQEQLRIHGHNQELVDEIKRLGREFGILTQYTSFLVVEEGIERDRVEEARRAFREFEQNANADSGEPAVDSAMAAQEMKFGFSGHSLAPPRMLAKVAAAADMKAEELTQLVKQVHDKTFYYRTESNTWYDSLIASGTVPVADIEVKAWSPDFFKLLERYPQLAKYMRAGTPLVAQIEGRIISVTPAE